MTAQEPAVPTTPEPKKRGIRPRWKWIAGAAVALIVLVAVASGGNKGTSVAPPDGSGANPGSALPIATQDTAAGVTAKLNTPYTIEGVTITIKNVEKSNGTQFLKPAAGHTYIGYLVNIAAHEDNQFVNVNDWSALSDGTKQGQWTVASPETWKPILSLDQIRNEASVEGWIAFEVPTPSSFVRLVYDPSFFSGDAKLTFDSPVK